MQGSRVVHPVKTLQDAPYSLEITDSNPGYSTADRDWGFPGGGAQLAEHHLGREGLGRQGNPQFTAQQRPLWLIGHLQVCSGAIQICVVLRHYGSAGFAVDLQCKFFTLTETPEDYTIIVDEEGFKELPVSEFLSVAEATWLALNVVSGGGSSSSSQPIGVTKIAKSVIAPLADHNISVFMLSTYQTDFILVRERDLPLVMHTLSSEFTLLRVVNGEAVAANSLGVTNGFVKPKLVQRPVIHPLSSPSNMFCVTSLDPDTLPSVATILMDVMFYSSGVKESAAPSDDLEYIRFFSFSLIEGYVSLVMDEETQKRFPLNVLFTSASGELWKMVRIGGQPLGFENLRIRSLKAVNADSLLPRCPTRSSSLCRQSASSLSYTFKLSMLSMQTVCFLAVLHVQALYAVNADSLLPRCPTRSSSLCCQCRQSASSLSYTFKLSTAQAKSFASPF
ncbi:UNVERIFIED_CONTAM: hypothetical protein FKN15_008979 [Acipenser sinensis]